MGSPREETTWGDEKAARAANPRLMRPLFHTGRREPIVVKPPAQPVFSDCGTTVLKNNSPVGFVVGTADFRSASGAKTMVPP